MNIDFRFAILSDPHIALPETIWNHPSRFHLVEFSIPALETVLTHLKQLALDFLLIPGDLTQHGEPENHRWLQHRLEALPFPVYVIPGNHDVPCLWADDHSIGLQDFPHFYRQFGYTNPHKLYYTCELLPGVQLIALNSNQFDANGKQLGCLDEEQLLWLEQVLEKVQHQFILVMVHHNVLEHLPGQSHHQLGQRYMLDNALLLRQMLEKYGVKLVLTGHLHVQDIARSGDLYEITTGSLVSYPHPYRILHWQSYEGKTQLNVKSYWVRAVPEAADLQRSSREWMGDRSLPFMTRLLTDSPLKLSLAEAHSLAPRLRYFWADIAAGDTVFNFSTFPESVRHYLEQFGAIDDDCHPAQIDNHTTIEL
ncbi:MAG: metallophosphoesterase family protein [Cyanophyceae cyanobacterium]